MENDRPKEKTPREIVPFEKKRKLPPLPLAGIRLRQPGERWPGELATFPDPKRFVKHLAELVRDGAREQATEQPDTPAGEQAMEQPAAPAEEQPAAAAPEQTVFDRVAELEGKVAELEAKEARRRERVNARSREWRQKNLDKAREQTRERVRVSRARKRQADS